MGRKKGYKQSEEIKMKISETKKGIRVSPKTEFIKGCTPWNKGKKMNKGIGKNHPFWKGGSSRYWGKKVLKESKKRIDQCQICKKVGKMNIHHINGNSKDNNIQNLGVVCSYCHFAIHNNGKNTRFGGGIN